MSITSRTFQLIGLLAIIFYFNNIHLVQSRTTDESKNLQKYNFSQSEAQYLSPGGEVVLSVDWLTQPQERVMVLTFDDGPDEKDLEIASILKKNGVSAAFFYIGDKVPAKQGIVQEIMKSELEIGYHSYQHQKLTHFSLSNLVADFNHGKANLKRTGVPLTWFRPPYGDFNPQVIQTAKRQGLETILWTIDSRDWTGISASSMARNVIRQFHPGAVLLFHSTQAATLQALPEVIAAAKRENYRLVSLKEWRQTILTANCRMSKGTSCPDNTTVATAHHTPTEPTGSTHNTPVDESLPPLEDERSANIPTNELTTDTPESEPIRPTENLAMETAETEPIRPADNLSMETTQSDSILPTEHLAMETPESEPILPTEHLALKTPESDSILPTENLALKTPESTPDLPVKKSTKNTAESPINSPSERVTKNIAKAAPNLASDHLVAVKKEVSPNLSANSVALNPAKAASKPPLDKVNKVFERDSPKTPPSKTIRITQKAVAKIPSDEIAIDSTENAGIPTEEPDFFPPPQESSRDETSDATSQVANTQTEEPDFPPPPHDSSRDEASDATSQVANTPTEADTLAVDTAPPQKQDSFVLVLTRISVVGPDSVTRHPQAVPSTGDGHSIPPATGLEQSINHAPAPEELIVPVLSRVTALKIPPGATKSSFSSTPTQPLTP